MKYLLVTIAMLRMALALPLFVAAILLKSAGSLIERVADTVVDGPSENKIV